MAKKVSAKSVTEMFRCGLKFLYALYRISHNMGYRDGALIDSSIITC